MTKMARKVTTFHLWTATKKSLKQEHDLRGVLWHNRSCEGLFCRTTIGRSSSSNSDVCR